MVALFLVHMNNIPMRTGCLILICNNFSNWMQIQKNHKLRYVKAWNYQSCYLKDPIYFIQFDISHPVFRPGFTCNCRGLRIFLHLLFWRFSLINYSFLVTLVRISFLVHLMWCQNLGLLAYNTEYVFIMYISRN